MEPTLLQRIFDKVRSIDYTAEPFSNGLNLRVRVPAGVVTVSLYAHERRLGVELGVDGWKQVTL